MVCDFLSQSKKTYRRDEESHRFDGRTRNTPTPTPTPTKTTTKIPKSVVSYMFAKEVCLFRFFIYFIPSYLFRVEPSLRHSTIQRRASRGEGVQTPTRAHLCTCPCGTKEGLKQRRVCLFTHVAAFNPNLLRRCSQRAFLNSHPFAGAHVAVRPIDHFPPPGQLYPSFQTVFTCAFSRTPEIL